MFEVLLGDFAFTTFNVIKNPGYDHLSGLYKDKNYNIFYLLSALRDTFFFFLKILNN